MVKRLILVAIPLLLFANVVCRIENERIYCTYFIDRSDNTDGVTVEFHWYSPSGKDDRIKIFEVPPFYGSVYDYRFLPGRENGKWRVVARELEKNKSAQTSFELNQTEEFFEE